MARNTGPKCRLCRREGVKLFLKGLRCDTARCALERREYPPGMHTWSRRKFTAYGLRLREKQKLKRFYGILERQFRQYFRRAMKAPGNTGETLVLSLERRLDNVVALLGLGLSHHQARQLVRHGHILVNGLRVTLPARPVRAGDEITVANREKSKAAAAQNLEAAKSRSVPPWLELSLDPPVGKVVRLPTREEVSLPVQEQLIVELLSK